MTSCSDNPVRPVVQRVFFRASLCNLQKPKKPEERPRLLIMLLIQTLENGALLKAYCTRYRCWSIVTAWSAT